MKSFHFKRETWKTSNLILGSCCNSSWVEFLATLHIFLKSPNLAANGINWRFLASHHGISMEQLILRRWNYDDVIENYHWHARQQAASSSSEYIPWIPLCFSSDWRWWWCCSKTVMCMPNQLTHYRLSIKVGAFQTMLCNSITKPFGSEEPTTFNSLFWILRSCATMIKRKKSI